LEQDITKELRRLSRLNGIRKFILDLINIKILFKGGRKWKTKKISVI
jgi:hypothetical protein